MIRATLDTKNFSFEAYGQNRAAAHAALTDGLNRHAAAYQLAGNWFCDDDIEYSEIEINRAYRDAEIIN